MDKLGRRKSTAIFDFLSWSLPCLYGPSVRLLVLRGCCTFNGMMKIPTVSWDCLLIEDAQGRSPRFIRWSFSPKSLSPCPYLSVLVAKLTLAPAIRILYINAFIVMTAKLLILYKLSTETAVGKIRREATRDKSLGELLSGYRGAAHKIMTSNGTIFAIIISILVEIAAMLGSTFWQIIVSRRIGVPDTLLPIFQWQKASSPLLFLHPHHPYQADQAEMASLWRFCKLHNWLLVADLS